MTLELELGQQGRCGEHVHRSKRHSEGSQVHSGSEGHRLLFCFWFVVVSFFFFFIPFYFSEGLPWELKVV